MPAGRDSLAPGKRTRFAFPAPPERPAATLPALLDDTNEPVIPCHSPIAPREGAKKLRQETIAIVTVGLALAGLITTTHLSLRAEMRADREAIRAEARADRAEAQADREAIRVEARADREAFEKQILRLTQEQSRLTGIVEQMHTASR